MATVARVVEAVGVGAYLGGSVLIEDKNILAAAASILTIEARHQSFLNVLNGATGVPQPFDIALTPPQVLALAGGFIQECDVQGALKIKANDPLSITNNGTVTPGTLLTFDSPALANAGDKELSCQMLIGGNATALSLPIKECIVPSGLNGPVAIFLTTDAQPLAADVVIQDPASILCGPTIAFIDTDADALGALVRNTKKPVQSSDEITPGEAEDALSQASGSVSTESSTATDSSSTDSSSTDSSSTTATDSSSSASESTSSPEPTATPAPDGSEPAVQVIGVSSMCVSFLSSEALSASTDLCLYF